MSELTDRVAADTTYDTTNDTTNDITNDTTNQSTNDTTSDSVKNVGTPIVETGLRSFDESLPMALLRAREATMRRFRPVLADHDVTEQQWRVLRALADAEGPVTVGELIDRTFLLGPSLSRMLVKLDGRGLITRSADRGDARRSQVAISRSGRQLVAAIAPHSEAVYAEIGAQLGPADLELLYDLLRRTAAIKETR